MSFCGRDIYEKQSEIAGLQGMLAGRHSFGLLPDLLAEGGKLV